MTPVKISAQHSCNTVSGLKHLLLAGMGIAVIPKYLVESELQSGELLQVLEDYQLPKVEIYVAFQSRSGLPIRVRTFLDFIYQSV